MPITELLKENAKRDGDAVAMVELSPRSGFDRIVSARDYDGSESFPDLSARREMTWKTMDRDADRIANFCLSRGLGKGKHVAVLMKNAVEWFPIYLGIMRSGALVVPLNFRNTTEETRKCLELTRPEAIFFGPEYSGQMASIREDGTGIKVFVSTARDCPDFALRYFDCVRGASADCPNVPISDGDDAAIYFTSGTTGQPKAILHTHSAIMSVCATEQAHHGQRAGDVFLCMAPLFHTGAMMHWLGSLVSCGKTVLLRDGKPKSVLNALSDEGVTIAFMLVPWVQDILQEVENGNLSFEDYDLDRWRLMHIGAQPVPPELIARWREFFPEQQYDTNYGLSESMGPGCVHLGVENLRKVGAIGKPGLNWQARIVSDDGKEVPRGTIGELTVKGPGVMKLYYRDGQSTASALRGGWLYTGDMGYADEEGFIYLVDRKKDVIISGGENIFPIQIEDHIRGMG
ncbi:MAG: acyl--CoA ligase, partial [Synergistaceae bacterium]|nr:acyl--CoA ligase [Synergistaceae bacterium]